MSAARQPPSPRAASSSSPLSPGETIATMLLTMRTSVLVPSNASLTCADDTVGGALPGRSKRRVAETAWALTAVACDVSPCRESAAGMFSSPASGLGDEDGGDGTPFHHCPSPGVPLLSATVLWFMSRSRPTWSTALRGWPPTPNCMRGSTGSWSHLKPSKSLR